MKWGGYRSQLAKKKAIIVVAHAILVIIWHFLATGKPYDELGEQYFTRRADPEREARWSQLGWCHRSPRPRASPGSTSVSGLGAA